MAKQEKRKSKEATAAQKAVAAEPEIVATETETASPTEVHDAPIIEEPVAEEAVVREPAVKEPVVDKPIVEKLARDDGTTPTRKGYVAQAGLRTSMEMQTEERLNEITKEGEKSPTSPDSAKGMKSWLKTKFRRQSKTQKSDTKDTGTDKPVVGSTDLAEVGNAGVKPNTSLVKDNEHRKSSMEEVALARSSTAHEEPVDIAHEERTGRSKRRASSVSSVSVLEESQDVSRDDDFEEARDHFDNELAPPPTFPTTKSTSPVRDSKFHEEM
jgi:hypothetical protein